MSDCLFCKVVAGDIPANVIYEDDQCLAFEDINPQAPTHALVIPKLHLADQREVGEGEKALMGHLITVVNGVARDKGLTSFRTVINSGAEAGQTVFHLHLHLIGGRPMGWPPG